MFEVFKSSLVIIVLTLAAGAGLILATRRSLHGSMIRAGIATVGGYAVLIIPSFYAAFAGITASVAVTSRSRDHAAGVMIFMLITLPTIQFQIAAATKPLIPLSPELATVIGVALGIVGLRFAGRMRLRLATDWPAILLIVLMFIIAGRGTSITNWARVALATSLTYALPYFILRRTLTTQQSMRHAMVSLSYAAVALAVVAIFECVRVWPVYEIFKPHFGILALSGAKIRYGLLRAGGPLTNSSESAFVLSIVFIGLLTARSLFRSHLLHYACIAIVILGMLATQSRTAWAGVIVGCAVLAAARSRAKMIVDVLPAAAGTLIVGLLVAQSNPRFASLVGISGDAIGSNEYRRQLQDYGFEVVLRHPWLGQSTDQVLRNMSMLRQGEGIIDVANGYLAIALQGGIPVAILFIVALCWQARTALAARYRPEWQQLGALRNFAPAAIIAIAAMFPFCPLDFRLMLTTLIVMAIGSQVRPLRVGVAAPVRFPGKRARPVLEPATVA